MGAIELRQVLVGPLFSEPMRVETVIANCPGYWSVGLVGQSTERFRKVTLTAEQLAACFTAEPEPARPPVPTVEPAMLVRRPAYCRSRAVAILRADPDGDRSAAFMSAINYAVMGGITAEQFEAIARQHRTGCSGKYLEGRDRLREEITRAYTKTTGET